MQVKNYFMEISKSYLLEIKGILKKNSSQSSIFVERGEDYLVSATRENNRLVSMVKAPSGIIIYFLQTVILACSCRMHFHIGRDSRINSAAEGGKLSCWQ